MITSHVKEQLYKGIYDSTCQNNFESQTLPCTFHNIPEGVKLLITSALNQSYPFHLVICNFPSVTEYQFLFYAVLNSRTLFNQFARFFNLVSSYFSNDVVKDGLGGI